MGSFIKLLLDETERAFAHAELTMLVLDLRGERSRGELTAGSFLRHRGCAERTFRVVVRNDLSFRVEPDFQPVPTRSGPDWPWIHDEPAP